MKSFFALAVWLLLPLATFAQILKPVSWTYKPVKSSAKVGEVVELRFTANIRSGYHIYSSDVNPKIDGPLPTVIKLTPNKTFELVGKVKPTSKVETKFEEVFEGDTYLMHGPAQFSQQIKILSVKPVIAGNVDYQVCTDSDGQCIPGNDDFFISGLTVTAAPVTAPTAVVSTSVTASTVTRPASGTAVTAATSETALTASDPAKTDSPTVVDVISKPEDVVQEATDAPVGTVDASVPGADPLMNLSLWSLALVAFAAGLTGLATPCVYPIIPMTVSFFVKQQGGHWKALLYGLSIVLIYVLFGTVIAALFGQAAPNFISTHWFPNLLFFAIFFLFSLSFLGLFELTLPSSFINKMDAQSERGGLSGIFFMAFTLVLVSFSCTGPLVGSILGLGSRGQIIKPVVGMLGYSMAFALPFTLFALFPQWLKGLPKSGGWLNSVKVVLGFLELALALKFLSIADQVYHWHLLDREVFLALWVVIFAMLGLYFLGKLRLPHDSETKYTSVPKLLLAIGTFSFVVYMIPGLWGAPLKALSGYLPPETSQDFNLHNQSQAAGTPTQAALTDPVKYADLFHFPRGFQGFFDYQQALNYAKKVGKPVFIDFTGHGCVNCREMEARVWPDPAVMSRLQNDFVLVALYVDDKTELPESQWYTSTYDGRMKKTIGAQNADLQITKYNNNAQPHYCLVNGEGKLLVAPKNYDRDVANFVSFLDSGKAKF